jgi:hypothetical protein
MTINVSDNSPRINYSATLGQTSFPVPFVFFDSGDLKVYLNGVLKSFSTDYTVTGGNGSTGSITLVVGAALSDKIAITRDVPLGRSTDLTSTYSAPAINDQLDTIIAQIADIDDKASRAIQVNDYEVGASVTLPSIDSRKGKTIQFNSTTGALEVGPSGDDLTAIGSVTSEIASLAGISGTLTSLGGYVTEINAVGDNIASVVAVNAGLTNVNTVASGIANVGSVAASIADVNDVADSIGEVSLVAGRIGNIDTVALATGNIGTVAGSITQVNNVASISADVSTVSGLSTAIGTVNTNVASISTVSNSIDDVNDVANRITDVTSVADNLANVGAVAGVSANVSTVAGIANQVSTVAGITGAIATVNTNSADIATAAGASSNISSVAGSITSVNTVAAISSDVTAVSGVSGQVSTVAGSIGNVNAVAAEIDALVSIEGSVASAASSAATAAEDAADADSAATQALGYRDTASLHKLAAEAAATSATNTAAALTGFDLEAIAATKAVTATDVFVYDTSKDSDGGAWRKRTQGTSWYNETLNTATRGSRREFPAVAVIVAESNKVTIYDGDDPSLPMWMVFNAAGGIGATANFLPEDPITAVEMLGSTLLVSSDNTNVGRGGCRIIDFAADKANNLRAPVNIYWEYNGVISERNDGLTYSGSGPEMVGSGVNDVAMTVLPNAPIDAATGLPVPTIAVATDGGVSVIKDDGTVVDSAVTSPAGNITFYGNGILWDTSNSTSYRTYSIPSADGFTASGMNHAGSGAIGIACPIGSGTITAIESEAFANNKGVALFDINPAVEDSSMVAYTTSTYNTGWMNGDIKGAFLSDTDDTDLVGSGELVTNGTFDSDTSGWTFEPTATDTSTAGFLSGTTGGATNRLASQAITTVIGKAYRVEITTGPASTSVYVGTHPSSFANGSTGFATSASKSLTFIATTATTYLSVMGVGAGVSVSLDKISVKLADADRSVNANGLIVNGTVTRTPVATGADLVAYSGFSASNYLEQPYSPDLDFGTGDFSIMGWMSGGSTGYSMERAEPLNTGGRFGLIRTSTELYGFVHGSGGAVGVSVSVPNLNWFHFTLIRQSGTIKLFIDGYLKGSIANSTDITNSAAVLRIGNRASGSGSFNGSLALWRISGTAPSAEQIAKIYNDEKFLFQENAQATLYGTSDAVTALAHDDATGLLHVGTSGGRSVFQGLRRVSNTTTAVGTAISASNGLVVEE